MKRALTRTLAVIMAIVCMTSLASCAMLNTYSGNTASSHTSVLGSWYEIGVDEDFGNYYQEYTFDDKGTVVRYIDSDNYEIVNLIYEYRLTDNTVFFTYPDDEEMNFACSYEFDGETLVLCDKNGEETRFTKGIYRDFWRGDKKTQEDSIDDVHAEDDTSGVLPIVRFSEMYNISPTFVYGMYETYNGTVSADKVVNYANYLATRGYQRNTEAEAPYKDSNEYTYVFDGDNKYQSIVLSYAGGVFVLSYEKECVFESVDSTTNNDNNNFDYNDYTVAPYTKVQLDCPICYGLGEVICSSCHGTGYYTTFENAPNYGGGSSSYEIEHTCRRCNGTGYAMCTHCSGTGKVG
ncbi:MAG: zinc finger-like domain-containing protein [Eubacterium sp.]|nr:zinc finger-like domain-containing protein [Eubacterium sp.]